VAGGLYPFLEGIDLPADLFKIFALLIDFPVKFLQILCHQKNGK